MTRLSIRSRLIVSMVLTSGLALLIAGAALFLLDAQRARKTLLQEMQSLATLVGNRSTAALVFMDEQTAYENLSALSGLNHVGSVCLLNDTGLVFSVFNHRNSTLPVAAERPASGAAQSEACALIAPIGESATTLNGATVVVQMPVETEGMRVGTLVLRSSTAPLTLHAREEGVSLLLALSGALVMATLLALRLQRPIAAPLANVRDTANAVIASGDYALRAGDHGPNELGQMAAAFNQMLATIQAQNVELAESSAYTRQLFHDSRIALLVFDPRSGTVTDCNTAAALINGLTHREALMGLSPLALSAGLQRDGQNSAHLIQTMVFEAIRHGAVTFEWQLQRPSGDVWDAEANAMRIERQGRDLLLVSLQDVTERKRAQASLLALTTELEERVARRTQDLAGANQQLQTTLDALRHTQNELVQREKLASLGSLVAGVAHELNTPLGNAVTVTSTVEAELQALTADINSGALRRSVLAGRIDTLERGFGLIARNLHRASELVLDFKQVAVDQTSEKRRRFDLAATVAEVIKTLQPSFKHTPHHMSADVPAGIELDSLPGPLGQVLTNLIANAYLHGFHDGMQGLVVVSAERLTHDAVRIRVQDNGGGIAPENMARVFDPFFTTKLGHGGSGLGLNIVYNLVVNTLGGQIFVSSPPGQGACFTLDVPLCAPRTASPEAGDTLSAPPSRL